MAPVYAAASEEKRTYRSERSGFTGLLVVVCDLPECGSMAIEAGAGGYWFVYPSEAKNGDAWLTILELGLAHPKLSRENFVLLQPGVPLQGEWANGGGRVAQFVFAPQFIEDIASTLGLQSKVLQRLCHSPFTADAQIDALCRLLIDETERGCPRGAVYFEAFARALAVDMLSRVRHQDDVAPLSSLVPPQIRRAVQRLERQYSDDLSLAKLATEAGMSERHFARVFQQATGCPPHQYLLRVRVSHARALLTDKGRQVPLADVAAACGFSDQAHLGRHFRRAFGTTPAAYVRWQESSKRWPERSIPSLE